MKITTVVAFGLSATIALLTACTTPPKSAETKKAPAAQKQDYVQVNSMGSWIPRKVKKKEDVMADGTTVVEGSALRSVQDKGATHTVKDTGPK